MPVLYYGNIGLSTKRQLYAEKWRPVPENMYEKLKIKHLAPYNRGPTTWNHWWLRGSRPHTILAWNGMHGKEQLIILPGHIGWRDALIVAREIFGHAMPSAIVFRVNNHEGPYIYD